MVLNNIVPLTYNLRRIRGQLETARLMYWQKAFMDTYEGNIQTANNILADEAKKAVKSSQEYNQYVFELPLIDAALDPASLDFTPNSNFTKIMVIVRLEDTAGTIEDYSRAVELARKVGMFGDSKDINRASEYWKSIYLAARGQKVRGQRNQALLASKYRRTLELRLQYFRDHAKAPFWPLLDAGIAAGMESRGGRPYPSLKPTRFVRRARTRIENLFNNKYTAKLKEVTNRFRNEAININQLVKVVDKAVTSTSRAKAETLVPGKIIEEIRIGERKYKLYITSRGRLGIAQRVRY